MKQYHFKMSACVMMSLLFFTTLFDPTELALGLTIFPDTPLFFKTIAELFGNVVWFIGSFLLVGLLFMLFALLNDETMKKVVEEVVKKGATGDYLRAKFSTYATRTISIFLAMLMLGSGFWFTGFVYLLMILTGIGYMNKIRETIKKDYPDLVDAIPIPTPEPVKNSMDL